MLAHAFSFPDARFHQSAVTGEWQSRLNAALDGLPCRFRRGATGWRPPASYDEMQSDYIALFQVGGRRGPPCPLHEGHYTRDRGRTLRDLIRFYNFFGFRVAECVMPDHISVELEFMAQLVDGVAADPASKLRAQRDFLRSHLAWTAQLSRRVAVARPHPFFRSLVTLTSRLVAADSEYVRSALGVLDGSS